MNLQADQRAVNHKQRQLRQSLAKLLCYPTVLALIAGLWVSLMGWPLPSPVARTVKFAQASGDHFAPGATAFLPAFGQRQQQRAQEIENAPGFCMHGALEVKPVRT